jgi:uncharacterized protein (DUF1501 family)
MPDKKKDPVLVVIQLAGGNDFMNTIVPYGDPKYYDHRPELGIKEEDVLPINDQVGFNSGAALLKDIYDQGKMAVVQGVGHPGATRSHFRETYSWYTCETEKIVTEGWLGKAVGELDPNKENIVTAVNFGLGLPIALVSQGVNITSVNDLENLGLWADEDNREDAMERFKQMYAPAVGTGPVMDYLSETGLGLLEGEKLLKQAPPKYESSVEYASNSIAKSLRDVARVHTADLGTRVFYTSHGNWDTHANQPPEHARLLGELSGAVTDFLDDLKEHDAHENVAILVWTEFGRRVAATSGGTDHGAGGGSFIIGENVNGGLYAEYPSLEKLEPIFGEDLDHTIDFRSIYSTVTEQWLGLDSEPIVGGNYEQIPVFA